MPHIAIHVGLPKLWARGAGWLWKGALSGLWAKGRAEEYSAVGGGRASAVDHVDADAGGVVGTAAVDAAHAAGVNGASWV